MRISRPISRRAAMDTLGRAGLLGLGVAAGACGSGGSPADNDTLDVPASCVLAPRQVEGPFFFETGLERRDITEGLPGVPLTVRLQLVDVDDGCQPIESAAIEIWHCDAEGAYSGYDTDEGNVADAQGETFLRGFQATDRNGRVEFATIYPGWYPIRTIHIHVIALINGTEQVTTQLYFDQAVNDRIVGMPPYDTRGPQRVRNEDEPRNDPALFFELQERDAGFDASHVLGISRSAG